MNHFLCSKLGLHEGNNREGVEIITSAPFLLLCLMRKIKTGAPDRAIFELFESVKQIPYSSFVLKESVYFLSYNNFNV